MKATKEQRQALLLVDVGLTTMTQQQWQNDDSKQNEDLCVLENVKGTVLTPNIQGGLVLMLPCHAVISYDGDSSFSLKLQYMREYCSDKALVNKGVCLPPKCSPLWSCLNVVHDGAAVLDAMLLYGVGTTKFGNVSTKVGPPGLAMPQV